MATYDAGLVFRFTFVQVKIPKSSRLDFSLFSKEANKSCHSQDDKHSNIILRDWANVQARLVFRCLHIR